ncbi:hypothetical protein WJX72_007375 [[Myrmecia] bisecta]|uniref:Very-long-chain (3R)-3-hydroxyacyl-CoA dehydratase n=1 Tax=[Myrmecia] bisecta TaxID=41462 RepID=A0AAW1Q4J9_9CHLO
MAGSKYLILYNLAAGTSWAYIFALTVNAIYQGQTTQELWKDVELPLKAAQTAAVLEVFHSAFGLVRSPVMTTLMQITSRIWVVWGLLHPVPGPTTSGSIPLLKLPNFTLKLDLFSLLLAWSITEIIRYSFYALKEAGRAPYFLLWLRYTTFIVLYPLGVASELTMAYLAMPTVKKSHLWNISMPNAVNFSFDYYYLCWLAIAGYVPGLPQLYLYMFAQRKKLLGPPKAKRQ